MSLAGRLLPFAVVSVFVSAGTIAVVACSSFDSDETRTAEDAGPDGSTGASSGGDARVDTDGGDGGSAQCVPVPGNCQKECNADSSTGAEPDDTDVPPEGQCTLRSCSNGVPGEKPKAAGTMCPDGLCDGNGKCIERLGTVCANSAACPSGFCVDGVCCNEACTSMCRTCAGTTKGICENIGFLGEDPSYFVPGDMTERTCNQGVAGSACNGDGNCLRRVKTACNTNAHCLSGKCAGTPPDAKCLGAKGELCDAHVECASGKCMGGSCE